MNLSLTIMGKSDLIKIPLSFFKCLPYLTYTLGKLCKVTNPYSCVYMLFPPLKAEILMCNDRLPYFLPPETRLLAKQ